MIGLALQGGGARGAYQAGSALAFKQNKIKFNGVCGTSIGAFNGAMIASGKEEELVKFWQNVNMGEILGFNEKLLEKMTKKEHDLDYYKFSFLNILKILKKRGISIQGLENVLKNNLNEESLRNNKIDYGICTIRIKNLKPIYIFKEDMIKGKMFDYILASCYLPVFKMEKKIDNHYYLDGGFYDNTPLNMLIEKGYQKIYVIELNPLLNINRKPKKDIEIIRISPKRSLGGVFNFDSKSIEEIIKMGYYDTLRVIKQLDGYYYCFKNYPNFFYKFLVRKIPKKEINHLKGFFHVKTEKDIVIKSFEYIMKNKNFDYYQIYKPFKVLKNLQKSINKKHFVYNFIKEISFI